MCFPRRLTLSPCIRDPLANQIVDSKTTSADGLVDLFAKCLVTAWAPHFPMLNDVLVVVSPEHYATFVRGGYTSKLLLKRALFDRCNAELAPALRRIVPMARPGLGATVGAAVGMALGLVSQVCQHKPRYTYLAEVRCTCAHTCVRVCVCVCVCVKCVCRFQTLGIVLLTSLLLLSVIFNPILCIL